MRKINNKHQKIILYKLIIKNLKKIVMLTMRSCLIGKLIHYFKILKMKKVRKKLNNIRSYVCKSI